MATAWATATFPHTGEGLERAKAENYQPLKKSGINQYNYKIAPRSRGQLADHTFPRIWGCGLRATGGIGLKGPMTDEVSGAGYF